MHTDSQMVYRNDLPRMTESLQTLAEHLVHQQLIQVLLLLHARPPANTSQ